MYKAIIFDIDNTLLNYSFSEHHSMKQALTIHELHPDLVWEEFWGTFGPINFNYWMNKDANKHNIYQILEYSFTDTFKKLNRDTSVSKEIAQTYWNLFCNTCDLEPNAETILEHLHRDYSLGVITNGIGEAQRKRLEVGNLHHYFDSLVISDEVGYAKPDPAIFELALNELKVDSNEVLFIGDSLTDDYRGAVNAGIDFCFYNRNDQRLEGQESPKYVVKDLLEIKSLFK
ncbi:HAD family hydrolase [Paenibacillus sediminis]|uniref:Hydrolase of the HAD superfamily n=1 Tax=Paenibacillus sediminis TaxID=664909 RepID=A0ABS4H300_9BACL|nr:HAD family hydrolase [Paenibacillus sediminis]MBP1936917.1 putative hydrolase of the HAD superfamily [Paenibacillus sediminis]